MLEKKIAENKEHKSESLSRRYIGHSTTTPKEGLNHNDLRHPLPVIL